jgi:hypothetical protein
MIINSAQFFKIFFGDFLFFSFLHTIPTSMIHFHLSLGVEGYVPRTNHSSKFRNMGGGGGKHAEFSKIIFLNYHEHEGLNMFLSIKEVLSISLFIGAAT